MLNKSNFLVSSFIVFLLLLVPSVYSGFYGDLSIDVDNSGFVSILGKTDYTPFLNITNSQKFTSQKNGVWTLNISSNKNEVFDEFIFELLLPENSQISYMKTTPNFRIENVGSRIKIIGTGQNKPFTVLIQYKLNKVSNISSFNSLALELGLVLLIIIGIVFYYGRKLLHKENKVINLEEEIEDIIEDSNLINPEVKLKNKKYEISDFPLRQQKIIGLLKVKKSLTQDEIRETLDIPKSSISRNIRSLEIKSIISIVEKGRYNKITLNKKKLL